MCVGGEAEERSGTGPRPGELPRLAFISSVIDDELLAVRKRIVATLGQAPFLLPWAFEMTPASSEAVGDDYLRKVREATLVFWFAGTRTTPPVEREIAEALAADRRLLVFALPAQERDHPTEELLEKVRPHARYRRLADLDGLEAEIEAAVADELVRALDGEPSPSRSERLDSLGRKSRARCIQRWLAAGVELGPARELAGDVDVGAAPDHLLPGPSSPFIALVAEAGCGKSLACERVLQAAIAAQLAGTGEPVPVYVTAREAVGHLKELVTTASEGLGDPDRCGAVVLVDGADEAADGAALLLAEARELAHGWPRTRVLLGTRPLGQFDRIPEVRKLPRLNDAQARRIVGLAAGREITCGEQAGWSPPTKDAASVPLFALLIGRHIALHGMVGEASRTTLLAELAERGLEGAGEGARPLLRRLAVASIARGVGRVPRSELGGTEALAALESSRLIASSEGEVWFPLALMAQWFAAESLAEGEPSGSALVGNTTDLELWRYPLAILAATAGHREAFAVFAPLVEAHPGFVSQIVEESIVRWPGSRGSAPPRQEAGTRIRETMTPWLVGLGPLASVLWPRLSPDGRLPPLGIEVEGERLLVAWYAGEEESAGDVLSLPPGVRLGEASAAEAAAWPRLRGAAPPRQASWALRFTFDDLRRQLESILNHRTLPLEGTRLEAPRIWRAARAVLGLPETHAVPIDLSAVVERAGELEASCGEDPWRAPGHAIDLTRLIARLERLLANGGETLAPPPLEVERRGGILLSPKARNELTLDHVRAVYAAAIDSYVELTDSLFAGLRPFMQITVLLPAVLRGHVYLSGDPSTQVGTEHLQWWLNPLPPGQASEVEITGPETREQLDRFAEGWDEEADEATVRARAYRPEQARWIGLFLRSGYLGVHGPLAVEEIVYEWLWSDLQRIKWVGPGQIAESAYKTLP
jgi:hypothetical protein